MRTKKQQSIADGPPATKKIPIIAPTIEWVVETANSKRLAIRIQAPAPKSAQSIPNINNCGLS